MATTYLQLSNELLREMNEVELTSSNFSDSKGVQTHIKDIINIKCSEIEVVLNNNPKYVRHIKKTE